MNKFKRKETNMAQKKSKKINAIPTSMIAPCGMNCRLCLAYTRDKNVCPGCRGDDSNKSKYCITCIIKNCEKIEKDGAKYCFSCERYPCTRLKQLDKRYRTKYSMSMIENLNYINKFGIREFIRNEKEKWTCPECGEIICVHRPQCLLCGYKWH